MKLVIAAALLSLALGIQHHRGLFLWNDINNPFIQNVANDISIEEKHEALKARIDERGGNNVKKWIEDTNPDFKLPEDQRRLQNWADSLGSFGDFGQQFGLGDDTKSLVANQFGEGPKRPEKSGNQYIDTFNDYNSQLGTYTKGAATANDLGQGNPLTNLATTVQPWQEKGQDWGY